MTRDREDGDSLSAVTIQELLTTALRRYTDLAKAPADLLQSALSGHRCSGDALRQAVEAIYRRLYYGCVADLRFDSAEQSADAQLQRILSLDEERVNLLRYQVGLAIYKKAFKDAVSDGELTDAEKDHLDAVGRFFGLRSRHIKKAISQQALWFYSFKLSEALADGLLSEEEMAQLALVAQSFGLTTEQLGTVRVPDKLEILRAALTTIKSKGAIDDEDRDYIRALVHFLNAGELLKPCMMDLDLYAKLFAIRRGELPELDRGPLLLERAEHLHLVAPITYATAAGGRTRRQRGTLYVGSVRLRFVAATRSFEVRYKNILEASFQDTKRPALRLMVSSGKGSGTYRLSRGNAPAALLELREMIGFLIRKARRRLDAAPRTTSYIPDHVRSEVYARDGGRCVICGAQDYLEFDHIIPRSKGGASTVNNLQLLCRKCNSEKSDRI